MGIRLIHTANVTEAGIKFSPLGNGVFIVTVKGSVNTPIIR